MSITKSLREFESKFLPKLQDDQKYIGEGTFSTVTEGILPTSKTKAAEIAVTMSKDPNNDPCSDVSELDTLQELPASPFLEHYLYFGDRMTPSLPKKIAWKAEGDLVSWLAKNAQNVSPQMFRNIVGQILLGIKALHEANIAHRDIKLGNILVFLDQNSPDNVYLKISDLDSAIRLDSKNKGRALRRSIPAGTYYPPQYEDLWDALFKSDGLLLANAENQYWQLNFQELDLYAFGQSIREIAKIIGGRGVLRKQHWKADKSILNDCDEFVIRLESISKVSKQPRYITDFMKMPLFGETDPERQEFFAKLEKNQKAFVSKQNFPVDKGLSGETIIYYNARNTAPGDLFSLLKGNPKIQELACLIENLDNKLQYIKQNCKLEDNVAILLEMSRAIIKNLNAINSICDEIKTELEMDKTLNGDKLLSLAKLRNAADTQVQEAKLSIKKHLLLENHLEQKQNTLLSDNQIKAEGTLPKKSCVLPNSFFGSIHLFSFFSLIKHALPRPSGSLRFFGSANESEQKKVNSAKSCYMPASETPKIKQ